MSASENYQLLDNVHLSVTPAGAYYCVSGESDTPSRKLLRVLMQKRLPPALSVHALQSWAGIDDNEEILALLYRMQSLGWLEGQEHQQAAPEGSLEELLPDLLVGLSDSGKVLLADEQGFYLCSQGFPHETAEELSALSADLSSLYQRHQGLLKNNLNLDTSAWAMVDAAGNGQIGFWPLWVGTHRFVLVIKGVPLLNQPALMKLVWLLSIRYGS
ncbi:MAG: hypothetical protein DRQ39_09690 [Gammaproteobacteria bacterium]|nr:MAG: hypothetical protein DRQ39_09690 [Gammaproteobacteria bacterium]RKZ94864.1 MAG: hypothetical protein DRQ46_09290 [Gammaproteobacteria bacterium]HHA19401.1 hypothetical protein [Methylophaga sp.]